MRYEVKMSLQVGEGIGLDRCEYVGACIFFFFFFPVCICPCLCLCKLFKCGSGMESFCPHISLESLIRHGQRHGNRKT